MKQRLVDFDQLRGSITVNAKRVTAKLYGPFATAVDLYTRSGDRNLVVDLSQVQTTFADGIIPLITELDYLRNEGHTVKVRLPGDLNQHRLYRSMNWAHFLYPEQYETSEFFDTKHLPLSSFRNQEQQYELVNKFMKVILDQTQYSESVYQMLEWSVNEITDNVLQHAKSDEKAYFQATVFQDSINFVVCDTGIGILATMKEAYPNLVTDEQAITEAIKEGVTSKKAGHQGNGLAGTLNVVRETGGNYLVKSGLGRVYLNTDGQAKAETRPVTHRFIGTLFSATIGTKNGYNIDAASVLTFGKGKSASLNTIIDTLYEKESEDATIIEVVKEGMGMGTRIAGERLRNRTLNIIRLRPDYPHYIDWKDVNAISSSFADEYIGKLFLELGMIDFAARIRNVNMNKLVRSLIDRAAAQRLTQANDEQ